MDLLVEQELGSHPGLDHFRIADELSDLFCRKVDLNTPAMLGRRLEKVLLDARLLHGKASDPLAMLRQMRSFAVEASELNEIIEALGSM